MHPVLFRNLIIDAAGVGAPSQVENQKTVMWSRFTPPTKIYLCRKPVTEKTEWRNKPTKTKGMPMNTRGTEKSPRKTRR